MTTTDRTNPSSTAPSATSEAAALSGTTDAAALSDRTRAWAVTAGVSGIAANAALAGFYALARPLEGEGGTGWWLGPANDLLGTVFAAALIPVARDVARRFDGPGVRRTTLVLVPALGALAVAGPALVVGAITLPVQIAVAGVAVPTLCLWLVLVGREGLRTGALDRLSARWALACGAGVVAGSLLAVPALALLPMGSWTQLAALVPGLLGYLGIPVWPLLLLRRRRTGGAP